MIPEKVSHPDNLFPGLPAHNHIPEKIEKTTITTHK
jgi:hypothetical protein